VHIKLLNLFDKSINKDHFLVERLKRDELFEQRQ